MAVSDRGIQAVTSEIVGIETEGVMDELLVEDVVAASALDFVEFAHG